MSFENVQTQTINNLAIAGISAPVRESFSSSDPAVTNITVKAPNYYIQVLGAYGGGSGPCTVTLPHIASALAEAIITIVCADGSTAAGNLVTVLAQDSTPITGRTTMTTGTPSLIQIYNCINRWVSI